MPIPSFLHPIRESFLSCLRYIKPMVIFLGIGRLVLMLLDSVLPGPMSFVDGFIKFFILAFLSLTSEPGFFERISRMPAFDFTLSALGYDAIIVSVCLVRLFFFSKSYFAPTTSKLAIAAKVMGALVSWMLILSLAIYFTPGFGYPVINIPLANMIVQIIVWIMAIIFVLVGFDLIKRAVSSSWRDLQ